ncbi:MAG: hypothetical protein OJF49_001604 [Ktedonobacterales bacterium]|nr:MAG: hypothetical protein OJF49_001604 [Ktedonobacterales bacterium]
MRRGLLGCAYIFLEFPGIWYYRGRHSLIRPHEYERTVA